MGLLMGVNERYDLTAIYIPACHPYNMINAQRVYNAQWPIRALGESLVEHNLLYGTDLRPRKSPPPISVSIGRVVGWYLITNAFSN